MDTLMKFAQSDVLFFYCEIKINTGNRDFEI